MRILCQRGTGSIPVVVIYLVWDGGQRRDSVTSARVNPALHGYLEKFGEGKQERFVKAQDDWPPPSKKSKKELDFLAEGP